MATPSNPRSAYKTLIAELREISLPSTVGSVLNWDEQVMMPAPQMMAAPAAAPAHAAPAGAAKAAAAPADDLASNPGTLTSPMVGTAYLSPEPGKPAFVAIGARVSEGQTILIIEAMKTMNQIPSTRAGTVTQILVEDGQPVEYGEPLVIIE